MVDSDLTQAIARAVQARLGQQVAPDAQRLLGEDIVNIVAALQPDPGSTRETPPLAAAMGVVSGPARPESAGHHERIVLSANGRNRSGIVARLTAVISDFGGDIRDISQTIVGDYFTMLIVVDVSGATHKGTRFTELKTRLQAGASALGVHVVALHDDLLTAMHTV